MARWHPVKVTIGLGDDEDPVFDAYTQGDSWNGWAIPFFTAEEGQRIAAWTHALAEQSPEGIETATWDEARRVFVLEDPQYPHATGEPIPDEDIVDGVTVEDLGLTLYGIGAYKWAWETVATPSPV